MTEVCSAFDIWEEWPRRLKAYSISYCKFQKGMREKDTVFKLSSCYAIFISVLVYKGLELWAPATFTDVKGDASETNSGPNS